MKRTEKFDQDMLKNMQSNLAIDKLTLNKLYPSKIKNQNFITLTYDFNKKYKLYGLGRLYCDSLFDKTIQYPLLSQFYKSVKIENLYYKILKEYAKSYNVNTPTLDNYLTNKTEFLSDISDVKKIAKNLVKLACCGNSAILADLSDTNIKNIKNDNLKNLKDEIDNLAAELYKTESENEDYKEMLKKNDHNKKIELLSVLVKTKEREKIIELVNYFEKTLKLDVGRIFHNKIFVENKEFVIDDKQFGKLKIKYLESDYEYVIIDKKSNDNKAALKLIELLGDNVIVNDKVIYCYDIINGIYSDSDELFYFYLQKYEDQMYFGNKSYVGDLALMVKLRTTMSLILSLNEKKTKFIENNRNSSMGKLLFNDRILDVTTYEATIEKNNKILFYSRIPYDVPTKYCHKKMNELYNIFFENGFHEDKRDAGLYLLKAITMAILGDYTRKKVYVIVGPSNSGKSLISDYLGYVFGDYVGTFPAEKLAYKANSNRDYSTELYWVKSINNKRIVVTNECKEYKNGIDSELVKKLSSDYDKTPVRKPHSSIIEYITNQSIMFLFLNNIIKFNKVDSGIINRVKYILLNYGFVDVVTDPTEQKQKDPNLYQRIRTPEYRDAFLYLILWCYHNKMTDAEKAINGSIIEPQCVIDATRNSLNISNDIVNDDNGKDLDTVDDMINHFNKFYKITNDQYDMVESMEIRRLIYTSSENFNENTYNQFLKQHIPNVARVKNIRYRTGIKARY